MKYPVPYICFLSDSYSIRWDGTVYRKVLNVSSGKKVWVVYQLKGTTNRVMRDPNSGLPLYNLDEDAANAFVKTYRDIDPEQTYGKVSYMVGELGRALVENDLLVVG